MRSTLAFSSLHHQATPVATKIFDTDQGYTSTLASVDRSLSAAGLDYVDLFLIHNPVDHDDIKAVWKGLEEAKAAGLTKSIGVSNFQASQLKEILEIATVIQRLSDVPQDRMFIKAELSNE